VIERYVASGATVRKRFAVPERLPDVVARQRFREGLASGGGLAVGTISSSVTPGNRSSLTSEAKASFPCCEQVRSTLIKISCVRAPFQVRLPPQTFPATTAGRRARSPTLLVASSPGQCER
jgi:hypothetical protein